MENVAVFTHFQQSPTLYTRIAIDCDMLFRALAYQNTADNTGFPLI